MKIALSILALASLGLTPTLVHAHDGHRHAGSPSDPASR
jgi:hypothetical protein